MMECPYCHNASLRYSRLVSLHFVRMLMGSEKRYCTHCEKKWRVRSRTKTANMSFYVMVIPLTVAITLGMFQLSEQKSQVVMKSEGILKEDMSAAGVLWKMNLDSKVPVVRNKNIPVNKTKNLNQKGNSQMLSLLPEDQRKVAEHALKNMSQEEIFAKLKKLEANPHALSKLSGPRREMAEQALKYMKTQKSR